jgi:hypothetical protein
MLTTFCPQCGSKKNFRRSSCGTVQPCKACGYSWVMPYPGSGAKSDGTGLLIGLGVAGALVLGSVVFCCGLGGLFTRSTGGGGAAAPRAAKVTGKPATPIDPAERDAELARIREREEATKLKAERDAEAKRLAEEADARRRADEVAQKNEASAVAKLKIAIRFLEENGNKEMARKKANEVIEQFPDTRAAAEAKAFVAKLGK